MLITRLILNLAGFPPSCRLAGNPECLEGSQRGTGQTERRDGHSETGGGGNGEGFGRGRTTVSGIT